MKIFFFLIEVETIKNNNFSKYHSLAFFAGLRIKNDKLNEGDINLKLSWRI